MYLALPLYQRDLANGRVPTAADPAAATQAANGRPGRDGNGVTSPELRHAADDDASGSETDTDGDDDGGIAGRADGPRDGGVTLHGVVRRTAKLADDRRVIVPPDVAAAGARSTMTLVGSHSSMLRTCVIASTYACQTSSLTRLSAPALQFVRWDHSRRGMGGTAIR